MPEKGVSVARTTEFKRETARLYRVGRRGIRPTARQLGVAPSTLRTRARQAEVGEGLPEGRTSVERAELLRLRREVRIPWGGEGDPPQSGGGFKWSTQQRLQTYQPESRRQASCAACR